MTDETPVGWKGKKGNEYDDFFLVGDVWQVFHFAAQEIGAKLGVSTGVSNRVLRELCASGEVQSILVTCRNAAQSRSEGSSPVNGEPMTETSTKTTS